MNVTVLLFSHVRHQLGESQLELEFAEGSSSADVETYIRRMLPASSQQQPFRVAVNEQFVEASTRLCDGDEVAILPPMQGG